MNNQAAKHFNTFTLTFFAAAAACLLAVVMITDCAGHNGEIIDTAKSAASLGEKPATKALENLQTAFNGESNANAKYLAFAKKADDEGYTKVGSLFRAAARAEEQSRRSDQKDGRHTHR